ncbi:MarR family winged helix-turn-helix transcriptional regulator [Chitinophaga eiseniae]|uniref:MarR family transcriptional regulator n=1 Tax=Chitinophaga eiseniae TaxID=634771 RepID=A0A847SGM8_9BACT|nr:MarR family transcriptional regulator [Chitinophaga eiseniae]NLR80971.1 MarR family transcriptional regulator [Chitinophaga eiseniae]
MATKEDLAIAHALRHLVTRMNKRLRREMSNPGSLSIAERNVVSILMNHKALYPSELGAQLDISSQFMSQILKRLEGLGYIDRKAAQEDKRKTWVALTKKGWQMVNDSRLEREEWLAGVIGDKYNSREKKLIREALELLSDIPEL